MLFRQKRDVTHNSNAVAGMLKGAIAGAVGVWAMDRVDWFMFNREDPNARQQTKRARPHGMDPAHEAVNKMNPNLSSRQLDAMGSATHYGLGATPGAAYGSLRNKIPKLTAGRGTLFGLGLFLTKDEGLNAVSSLAASPKDYPWQAHARGFVAHLVYGVVTDSVLRCLDRGRR